MENIKKKMYMVTYKDDFNKKHMIFVEKYSEVMFLKDRFDVVDFEKIQNEDIKNI